MGGEVLLKKELVSECHRALGTFVGSFLHVPVHDMSFKATLSGESFPASGAQLGADFIVYGFYVLF